MTPRIQFRENDMRAAIQEFRACANELRQSAQNLGGSSKTLNDEQGALFGAAGEKFQKAIAETLVSRMEDVAQALERQARFAETELEQMIEAARSLR